MFLDFFCCFFLLKPEFSTLALSWASATIRIFGKLSHIVKEGEIYTHAQKHTVNFYINWQQPLFALRSNSNCVDWNRAAGAHSRSLSHSIHSNVRISIRKIIALSLSWFYHMCDRLFRLLFIMLLDNFNANIRIKS